MTTPILYFTPPIGMPVTGGGGVIVDLTDVAKLSQTNVFQQVNTVPGIRLDSQTVTANYTLLTIDYEIRADATAGPISLQLPQALGSGQKYYIKKVDATTNPVTVIPVSGDDIDGASVVVLGVQDGDIAIIDGDVGDWDRQGAGIADYPQLSINNVFTGLNTFNGIRFSSQTVAADYSVGQSDFAVLADPSSQVPTPGPINITLPSAIGSGQLYYFEKIDSTAEVVTIYATGTDTIGGSTNIAFVDQGANALLCDTAPGYWSNIGWLAPGPTAGVIGPTIDYEPQIDADSELATWTTFGKPINSRVDVIYPDGLRSYIIASLAADPADPGHVAPNDYDPTFNNVHLQRV